MKKNVYVIKDKLSGENATDIFSSFNEKTALLCFNKFLESVHLDKRQFFMKHLGTVDFKKDILEDAEILNVYFGEDVSKKLEEILSSPQNEEFI